MKGWKVNLKKRTLVRLTKKVGKKAGMLAQVLKSEPDRKPLPVRFKWFVTIFICFLFHKKRSNETSTTATVIFTLFFVRRIRRIIAAVIC